MMKPIDTLMRKAISNSIFPGGVLLASKANSIIFFEAYGYANIFSRQKMTKDTFFDLASLTKPLATTLAIMRLIKHSKLDIEQDLGSVLPRFKNTDKSKITIKQLLCHDSGFPDYRPYYRELYKIEQNRRRIELREILVREPLIHPPGQQILYSDIGFMILAWVVESLEKKRLDHLVIEDIYRPLGLNSLFFVDLDVQPRTGRFAATELCPWRKFLLDGTVHDENAYVVGGIEGHAGLFGTAEDVHTLLSLLLSTFLGCIETDLFQQDLLHTFFEPLEKKERPLGFDKPSLPGSSCGHYFSKKSVGHLGFTGTSFWMDLDRSVIIILLTNRVHPSRNNTRIKEFRPKLHDRIMEIII